MGWYRLALIVTALFLWAGQCVRCLRSLRVFKVPPLRKSFLVSSIQQQVVHDGLENFVEVFEKNLKDFNIKSVYFANMRHTSSNKFKEGLSLLNDVRKIDGRLVTLKSGPHMQLIYKYGHNEQAKNYNSQQVLEQIRLIICSGKFRLVTLNSLERLWKLQILGTTGNPVYRLSTVMHPKTNVTNSSSITSYAHDLIKPACVSLNEPFLAALGITCRTSTPRANASTVRPRTGMSDKLHQIKKYVEIMDNLVRHQFNSTDPSGIGDDTTQEKPLRIMDMGSGLAYLTFAVHAHFQKSFPGLQTTGVEVRPALVQQTERIARSLGSRFDGLKFQEGSILSLMGNRTGTLHNAGVTMVQPGANVREKFNIHEEGNIVRGFLSLPAGARKMALDAAPPVDILMALHACDTATDDAIYYGICSNASIIIVAPCCHKQLRPQLDTYVRQITKKTVLHSGPTVDGVQSPDEARITPAMRDLLVHGIYRERQAEMVTDSLRALYLQFAGYDTKVFEFVSGTHTAKNVMITATRRKTAASSSHQAELLLRIGRLKSEYGIHRLKLEELLHKSYQ